MLLTSTPGIDSPTIDFGVEYPDDTHFCRSFNLPPDLIAICGELGLGIELSVYREADKSKS